MAEQTKNGKSSAQTKAETKPVDPKLGAHATRFAESLTAANRKQAEARAKKTAKENGIGLVSIEMLGVAAGIGPEGSDEVKALRRQFGPPSSKSKKAKSGAKTAGKNGGSRKSVKQPVKAAA